MLLTHVVLFLLWLLYYAIHSILASTWIKSKLRLSQRTYRLWYSMIATILFLIMLLYTATTYSAFLFTPTAYSNYSGLMVAAVGIFILKRSFRQYSLKEFLGFKSEENSTLNMKGIQSKVRHPLYSGTVLIFIGYFLFNPQIANLVMLLSLVCYLPFGIYWEEKKLIKEFGEHYVKYKKVTGALIPKLRPPSI